MLEQIGGFDGIESINAYGCKGLTGKSLRRVPADLRALNIGQNCLVTIQDILHITNLTSLNLSHSGITEAGRYSLSSLTNLRVLNM